MTQLRAGGDRLGDVAAVADAAVGDDRHARGLGDADGLEDRRHLRHADAADDPRRADRARGRCRPSPPSTPASIRSFAPSAVATLPAITWMSQFFLISRTVSMTFSAVPVGGVDDDDVDVRLDQRLDPGEVLHARRRPDAQPAALVLAGVAGTGAACRCRAS